MMYSEFSPRVMPFCFKLLLAVLALACLSVTRGSNILIMSPIGTKSHINFYGEIVSILLERGHTITLVTSYPFKNQNPNLTHINIDVHLVENVNAFATSGVANTISVAMHTTPRICSDALENEQVQKLDIGNFDLVVMKTLTSECFLSLLDGKDVPRIILFPNNIAGHLNEVFGQIDFPSFVPALGSGPLHQTHPMGFSGRLKNTLLNEAMKFLYKRGLSNWILAECKQRGLCRQDLNSFMELEKKSSLLFLNNIRSLDEPARPFMPAVINVGALNCRPAEPLPEDLETWARGSGEDGFIYMSLGTAVTPSDMPEESRRILLEVFRSLPYRVLWKWNEDTIEGLPPNVKLAKWLPQQDILGHTQLKLFISHGGLFSLHEASYHGVPVLGMPVLVDQFSNVERVVSAGWGQQMLWADLEINALKNTIVELVTNQRYREVVQRRSTFMRDQLVSPRDEVAYWTEYVIRHKGASHLRSPVLDMYWYEVYNVDVWLVLGMVIVTVTVLLLLLCGALLRCCLRTVRRKHTWQSNKKRQ